MVVQYKCPDCGSDLSYDIAMDSLYCSHCGHTTLIKDLPIPEDIPEDNDDPETGQPEIKKFTPDEVPDEREYPYTDDGTHTKQTFDDSVQTYTCHNCGASVVSDNLTASTTCEYCGSPVMIGDRLSGELAPTYIIPFQITKEQAEKALLKWCKNGRFTKREFKEALKVRGVSGIYVPFWLFDLGTVADCDAIGKRLRSYTRGNYRITETSHFHVYRRASLHYLRVPADASQKMDDKIMDYLEPFDYSKMVPFQMQYMAGFPAEKYTYDDNTMFPRVKPRAEQYARDYLRNSINGYSSVTIQRQQVDINKLQADYTMFPVWIFNYKFEDMQHSFVMNGQSGKIVGQPPLDKVKIGFTFAGIATAATALLCVLFYFI